MGEEILIGMIEVTYLLKGPLAPWSPCTIIANLLGSLDQSTDFLLSLADYLTVLRPVKSLFILARAIVVPFILKLAFRRF